MEGYFVYVSDKLEEIRFGAPEKYQIFGTREVVKWAFWRAVLAEFIGTLLFVFLGCASAVPIGDSIQPTIKIAFAFGLAIMSLIQMFGHVSGGHFNPAVSIGLAVIAGITPIRAAAYTLAQIAGAIIGGLILKGVTPIQHQDKLAVTSVGADVNAGQGLGVEIILTFVLVFVIAATTDADRPNFETASLKIGLTVTMLHMSSITYTGSSMNPARSLGSAVASNSYGYHWIYWIGPIVGGCLATIIYKYIYSPYRGAISKEDAVNKLCKLQL
ncbi:hypothetical protein FSP39_021464 [Pinctada imbricata]|uniref:Uncharacterized protein n=1 Tax=Pinctada imbricata TaxID=66713 RepID=A0AA88XND0_PINIB|nr:hypothetical protein FSP39_021464 [Pinctada imbricata]